MFDILLSIDIYCMPRREVLMQRLLLLLPAAGCLQFVPPGELVEGVQLAPPDNPFARLMGKQGSYDVNRCARLNFGREQGGDSICT
jgi:hypothetical protein